MKWFLIAVMSVLYSNDEIDTYIFTKPHDSSEACIEWVQQNNADIFLQLKQTFPNDKLDRLFCIDEEKLEHFLKANERAKSGTQA